MHTETQENLVELSKHIYDLAHAVGSEESTSGVLMLVSKQLEIAKIKLDIYLQRELVSVSKEGS